MRKRRIKIILFLLLMIILGTTSFAITQSLQINSNTFSFENKGLDISTYFDNSYNIDSSDKKDENTELKKNITELTKKTTYLLLGEINSRGKEGSENYYKRHKDYLKLRYNPQIPKDPSTLTGLDENSEEYSDDILSGISVPGMFNLLKEREIQYSSYGKILVSPINDELVISTIAIPDVIMKQPNENEPTKYDIVQTDLTMYYYFKKLDNEYKLYYLYGETGDEVQAYMEKNDEKKGSLSQNEISNSNLEDLYDFSKVEKITDDTLNTIYEANKSKIVYLTSTYNSNAGIEIIASANGFFIEKGIILTTYNYLEKALSKAQNIMISDSLGTVYELDGIVTINTEKDIAVLKVKNKNENYIEIKESKKLEKEDAVITMSSKTGVGLTSSKGIVTTADNDVQTSLPITEEVQGSPLFDANGNLVGMINSKNMDASLSYTTNIDTIKAYYDKFSNLGYENIKSIPFEELKEKYYIHYEEEKIVNTIPDKKWKEYNKVENVEDTIKLKLVKAFYKDKMISLRYKNDAAEYIDTMQLISQYRESLKNKGYSEKNISDSKVIYENKENRIIIIKEFDYLIIVMVKL